MEGKYHLKTTFDRNAWMLVFGSERIFVDGGAVIFYNEDDEIIMAVGAGEWIQVIHDDLMMEYMDDIE